MFQSEVLEAAFPIMPNTRTQLQKLGAEICHVSMILPGKIERLPTLMMSTSREYFSVGFGSFKDLCPANQTLPGSV